MVTAGETLNNNDNNNEKKNNNVLREKIETTDKAESKTGRNN